MQDHGDDAMRELQQLAGLLTVPQPTATLVWTAAVDVAPREALGPGPLGERFIVPITGGRFWGAAGFEAMAGLVRAGGADRQLLRADGVKELRAEYEMETADGAVLTVLNEVVVDDSVKPERYALSRITVRAPQGRHEWLNRRLFVGTLQSLRPQREAVLIRGYLVEA
ncbi:DUF3237 domain-containing protein [Ramlibacter albus]|uniref:DUF3237 family protein n=1 Tax=Ramlibacter albus TaxID=2079448 RepID=A0A923M976_9BURK|nr:DUF3237 domain-containing protein [Ramlibacter albus]MBC5766335.1 DUF3237 family protein [Ramlibacter albus]